MKHMLTILLLALLLFCGGVAAAETTFSVEVFDSTTGNSPVDGASVKIVSGSDSRTLITTASGVAEFRETKYPATYQVTVSKAGYDTQSTSVYVDTANKKIAVYLKTENPILLTVTASGKPVADAAVTVNNKAVGKTDAYGRLHAPMIRGAYNTLEVSAPSYITYHEKFFLESDATSREITLSISTVTPIILVYSDEKEPIFGASVKINGVTVGYTDSYGRAQLMSYVAGTYNITVEANEYVPYTGTVTFSSSTPSTTITLSHTISQITIKTLSGSTPVADTIIYFDGNVKGITNAEGVYTTSAVPNTRIYISASHEGYTADSISWTVQAGETNIIIMEMKQNVPVVLIGIGILAVIVLLVIVALVIGGKRRGRGPTRSPPNSYPPTNKRDSL